MIVASEVDTDQNDLPLDPPPKIKSVEVLWNPFEDIVPRVTLTLPTAEAENKDSKKKSVKKLNLLSFGGRSRRRRERIGSGEDLAAAKAAKELQLSVREALRSKREGDKKDAEAELSDSLDHSDDDKASFDARMRRQIRSRWKEIGDLSSKQKMQNGSSKANDNKSLPEGKHLRPNDESSDDDQPRVEKLSLKKKGVGSEARAERMAKADGDLQLFSEAERGRLLQKQKKRRIQGLEDEVLAKLEKFKQSVLTKPIASSGEPGGDDNEDLSDWKAVRLQFAPDTKDGMSRKDDPNDYVVVDPLLEKGKEKFNRMQAKQKRREREWAGKSLTSSVPWLIKMICWFT
ncbi:Peptidyl-prolyl cis-trans isomerase CYP57 [Hibiscus syriacus]|uniref:Peptidyl-prolyl cis-trans isomerase CYP57 n=1 Tax=Hibiscus syriacus TaxID=106335 RepID=A0A6A2Y310_HIBSY|nr:Peptidyl-prolyl cis-trans isomerase CYP57 [Hibiscus syriacus]